MTLKFVTFRLPAEDIAALNRSAKHAKTTRSKLLRAASERLIQAAKKEIDTEGRTSEIKAETSTKEVVRSFHLVLPEKVAQAVRDRAKTALQPATAWVTGILKRVTGSESFYFPSDLQALGIARAAMLDTARHLRDLNVEGEVNKAALADMRLALSEYTKLLTKIVRESKENPLS